MTSIQALLQRPAKAPAWQGSWARVWLKPDVFSAQEFIVGAMALDVQGLHDFRVVSSGERFGCIYGEGARDMFDRLLADLRHAFSTARAAHVPLPQDHLPDVFRVELVGSLRTQMPGETLERMLRDGTIPLEPDEPVGKKQRFVGKPAADVVQEVLDQVRLRAALKADTFIRDDFFADQSHQVSVNLVTPHAAGIVASGWYAGPDRIQLEFLRAANQVEAYSAVMKKRGAALFFRRPSLEDGLSRSAWSEVEDQLGQLEWELGRKGARVVTHSRADALAKDVVDWAQEFA